MGLVKDSATHGEQFLHLQQADDVACLAPWVRQCLPPGVAQAGIPIATARRWPESRPSRRC